MTHSDGPRTIRLVAASLAALALVLGGPAIAANAAVDYQNGNLAFNHWKATGYLTFNGEWKNTADSSNMGVSVGVHNGYSGAQGGGPYTQQTTGSGTYNPKCRWYAPSGSWSSTPMLCNYSV